VLEQIHLQFALPLRRIHEDSIKYIDAYLFKAQVTRSSAIAVIANRTACSILTLYSLWSQHLDLWIKKICLLSVRGSNNYCGSASTSRRVRSPHTSAALSDSDHWPVVYGTRACHCWQTSRVYSTRMPESIRMIRHLWRCSLRFLWCILWLNDTSYSKSVWRDK